MITNPIHFCWEFKSCLHFFKWIMDDSSFSLSAHNNVSSRLNMNHTFISYKWNVEKIHKYFVWAQFLYLSWFTAHWLNVHVSLPMKQLMWISSGCNNKPFMLPLDLPNKLVVLFFPSYEYTLKRAMHEWRRTKISSQVIIFIHAHFVRFIFFPPFAFLTVQWANVNGVLFTLTLCINPSTILRQTFSRNPLEKLYIYKRNNTYFSHSNTFGLTTSPFITRLN